MTGPGPASREAGAGAVVVGDGAVGSFVAALIAGSGERVVLAGRPGTGTRGPAQIVVRAPDGSVRRVRVERADGTAGLDRPAYVVLAVKMPDLAAALEACEAWPHVPAITLQNGIGAEALVAGGLPVAAVRDWRSMKWSKLLTNLVANAVPALLDRDAAAVYADRRLFGVERTQVREALEVMRALGLSPIRLPGADVRLLALGFRMPAVLAHPIIRRVVGGARGGKAPSLLLHLRGGGGPSESPWLNGGVARAGDAAGVPTPVNAALAALVESAAADPSAWDRTRGRPAALLAAINHAAIARCDP